MESIVTASKFSKRSPRYYIQEGDHSLFCFKHEEGGDSFQTDLLDISVSGAAFIVLAEHAPQIGEVLKIELPLPTTGEHIAWFAEVRRISPYKGKRTYIDKEKNFSQSEKLIIGIEFIDLPLKHQKEIEYALDVKFNEFLHKKRVFLRAHQIKAATKTALSTLAIIVLCVLSYLLISYLTKPTSNYSKEHGSPWGKRF